jgi:acetylornithine deacetylase/succinyl-diaminopimelate desuccinylase-like protein
MEKTQAYIQRHKDTFLEELKDLLRLPSVSADPTYKEAVLQTAQWVANALQTAGANQVDVVKTPGYPVVYGEKMIDPSKPTVVVYGHYDVQPPDPLDLWNSPPFEPVIQSTPIHPEGAIFARGACDDKGQFFMHLKAFQAMVAAGELPCNVKFMIEGEEEVGSSNLAWFIKHYKERLSGDVILISDTGMLSRETPSITTGLRGLSYVEVAVTGPNRDLHSGLYGGAVPNPINVLAQMIARLHHDDGSIAIPGFYDAVENLSPAERAEMARAPFSLDAYKQALNLKDIAGETGYTTPERTSIRPTLDVNGIWGGYTGEGAKTVIPSKAYAKISMRLVPHQDPDTITALFTQYFESIAPDSVTVQVTPHHGGLPYVAPTNTHAYRAASKAMEKTFSTKPIPVRSGGSIPIVSLFESELGMKSILLGFGLDSDAIHSPNEHYGLFNFFRGIETIPYFYEAFSQSE